MIRSGCLVSPATSPSKQTLWDETWKRVDRFLPDLRQDLASESAGNLQGGERCHSEDESAEVDGKSNGIFAVDDVNSEENLFRE